MFERWAGTDIYVPAIWGQEYPMANKGYARHYVYLKIKNITKTLTPKQATKTTSEPPHWNGQ